MANAIFCGREGRQLLAFREDLKGAGIFLFCEAKAKMPSRGREIFSSEKILVTKSSPEDSYRCYFSTKYE
jgi:hypothetical protein